MDTVEPSRFIDPEVATAAADAHNAAGHCPRVIPMLTSSGLWELVPNELTPTDYWRAIQEAMAATLKGASSAG